jgi:hypothetical protein
MPEASQQPTGNLEIYSAGERNVEFVTGTQWRVASGYLFQFTRQGNLEVRNPAGQLVWESRTRDAGASRLRLESSGDLAICAAGDAAPVWSTGTAGNQGAFLAFQMDGNLVLYSSDRSPLWATDTNGK